jgi:hypothetical protein
MKVDRCWMYGVIVHAIWMLGWSYSVVVVTTQAVETQLNDHYIQRTTKEATKNGVPQHDIFLRQQNDSTTSMKIMPTNAPNELSTATTASKNLGKKSMSKVPKSPNTNTNADTGVSNTDKIWKGDMSSTSSAKMKGMSKCKRNSKGGMSKGDPNDTTFDTCPPDSTPSPTKAVSPSVLATTTAPTASQPTCNDIQTPVAIPTTLPTVRPTQVPSPIPTTTAPATLLPTTLTPTTTFPPTLVGTTTTAAPMMMTTTTTQFPSRTPTNSLYPVTTPSSYTTVLPTPTTPFPPLHHSPPFFPHKSRLRFR